MKAEKGLALGEFLGGITNGFDKTSSDEKFVCTSNTLRVAALEDSYILNQFEASGNDGVFFPQGQVEYFKVNIGDIITVISGTVNLSCLF